MRSRAEVGPALAHRAPQGQKHAQGCRRRRRAGQRLQHLGAHAQHAQQAADLQRGRCGLHLGGAVDETRQAHGCQRLR